MGTDVQFMYNSKIKKDPHSREPHGIYESNNKVGSILQSMSPKGIDIITKPNKGSRLYKLKWRYN